MLMNEKLLAHLRETYPAGTRVELVRMDDVQAPPIGTKGTAYGDGALSFIVAPSLSAGFVDAGACRSYRVLPSYSRRTGEPEPVAGAQPERAGDVTRVAAADLDLDAGAQLLFQEELRQDQPLRRQAMALHSPSRRIVASWNSSA